MSIVFLLYSFAALPSALRDMQAARQAGSRLLIYVFYPPLMKFLKPLADKEVEIIAVHHSIYINAYRLWNLLIQGFRTRRWLKNTFGNTKNTTIYFYNDGYNLSLLAAIAFLAKQGNSLFFEDWDHTRLTGLDKQVCHSLQVRLIAFFSSLVSGAPIVMLRPHSPFPNLQPQFYRKRKITSRPKTHVSFQMIRQSSLGKLLVYSSAARIFWLWDDFVQFYGDSQVPAKPYFELYDKLFSLSCQILPLEEQVLKPHPSLDGRPVDVCKGVSMIPAYIPVEFIKFTGTPIAITISSYSMKSFLSQKFPVISILRLLKATDEVIEEQEKAICDWIGAEDLLFLPKTLNEFFSILSKLAKSNFR